MVVAVSSIALAACWPGEPPLPVPGQPTTASHTSTTAPAGGEVIAGAGVREVPCERGGGYGRGNGGGGGRGLGPPGDGVGPGPAPEGHRDDIAALFENRDRIQRRVVMRTHGVETWTLSDDPEVASLIARHADAMTAHVREGGRVRPFDPLFRKLSEHHADISVQVEVLDRGVHVVERGATPDAVALVQAHARAIDLFLARGHDEAMRCHDVATDAVSAR